MWHICSNTLSGDQAGLDVMNIGYLIPGCSISGGLAVICQHANRLMRRGHTVVLLSITDAASMDWFPGQQAPVARAIDWTDHLDVVVATEWGTAFWLSRMSASVKCYFVQSDETRFHPEGSRWQHLAALSYYHRVNYLTEARWIRAWLRDGFGHDAVLVPNGLDPEIFSPAEPLVAKTRQPRILLEGAIGLPYKGMREAFAAVHNLDAEVWCVSSFGVPAAGWKCDRFFEHVPMRDMRRIYSSCDILLKLSRVEGFFGPPMEMMACGGAVVVGQVTGSDEYIKDGENALVVDALDIEAATAAVQRLIDDRELRERLVEGGRRTAQEWSWEPSIDILESYYEQLLKSTDNQSAEVDRLRYDRSLSFAYNKLSSGVLPEDIVSSGPDTVPPHVQRLAASMAGTWIFQRFADVVRVIYRLRRWLRGLA